MESNKGVKMSFRKTIVCRKCQNLVWVSIPAGMPEPKVCEVCENEERQRDLDEYLLERESMSIEERVSLMEKDLCDILDKFGKTVGKLNKSLDNLKF
jgi:hypothetical protein